MFAGAFQILHRDGMGRIGKLSTAHGEVTTPALMPVLDPSDLIVTPRELSREFDAEMLMTNAYLILRRFGRRAVKRGVHGVLGYQDPIATDSGGFQILRYGGIEVPPEEIVRYQDEIAPDLATILDFPTGIRATRERSAETVRVTLERAKQAVEIRSNPKVIWCGPVQGGLFSELVAQSAREVGKLDYQLHAIGSPVELFEGYRYAELVDLVMTAKLNLPLNRPTHLFGAGHPMVFGLSVVMGCDLFDSASYALYARAGRYLTSDKTLSLRELSCLPCECPVCVGHSLGEFKGASEPKRSKLLAKHNLHVMFGEIRRVRQAIAEGRLWEHVELRCRAHPRLLEGIRRLARHREFIERFEPMTKPSAFGYLGPESADRPEVLRYERRLQRYEPPPLRVLALAPIFERGMPKLEDPDSTHLVRLVPPFGVIPEELEEVYPLGQFQVPRELDAKQVKTVADSLSRYLERFGGHYERIVLFNDPDRWGDSLVEACAGVKEKLSLSSLFFQT